ncbi:MAG: BamA/TamA family outer membrane protein [Pirellulaceae bacterium]|nr:BamA/TamA family outer membrane protein [Pirellulaceae bacterium]
MFLLFLGGCNTFTPAGPLQFKTDDVDLKQQAPGVPTVDLSQIPKVAQTNISSESFFPEENSSGKIVVRGQSPPALGNPNFQNQGVWNGGNELTPGGQGHTRYPMSANNAVLPEIQSGANQQGVSLFAQPPVTGAGISQQGQLGNTQTPNYGGPFGPTFPPMQLDSVVDDAIYVPLNIYAEPAEVTGKFSFGAAVNSDTGLNGQISIDERDFDWRRVPTSFNDIYDGSAFRGAGQHFRIEAVPGSELQRYMLSFSEPYLLDTQISFGFSGYYYDRRYVDWDETRKGGRVSLGYNLTHDLSISTALKMEKVDLYNPSTNAVADLNNALGSHDVFSGSLVLSHDTRDLPFAPSEGHLIEFNLEQVFGTESYQKATVDYRRYFLLYERLDGSGRHTFMVSNTVGFAGSNTPIFDHFYAGGHSTMRGFDLRGAVPKVGDIYVGGQFQFLGSLQYMFPITADDMIKGVAFVDYGTVEEKVQLRSKSMRVAPGLGLRISVPLLSPAPLAFDFAVPVNHLESDKTQTFSFFLGVAR